MSNASQNLFGAMDPLPPDPSGYCYLDRDHFNVFTQGMARRLILKHGPFVDRLPLWGVMLLFTAVIIAVALASSHLPSGSSILTQLLCLVLLGWYLARTRRFVKTIIRQRMCFQCGYPLLHAPTDANGDGVCSECGRLFHIAYYHRPPRKYKRAVPRHEEPAWLESVHPLDRAQMLREPSHAQQRENSDQGREHPTG